MSLTEQDINRLRVSYPIKTPRDIKELNFWLECLEEYQKEVEEESYQHPYIPYSSLNYSVKKCPDDPSTGAATRERMEDLVTKIGRSERRDKETFGTSLFIDECPEIEISEDSQRLYLQGFDYRRQYPDHIPEEFHNENRHRYIRNDFNIS
ncbi:hypothetical protein ACX27_07870 [Nostoc piscinale CENA21]|uniref:Uncharacterized protein n=1 Tax=Nostoc piscinale CENA21 TaxID=224013 RepID=A0A0M4T115_9NOSO|nr:hypothetical protein [Nostoc piscinale]ALF52795.1 hypothetical protein ACX27_07870 [Nostoc piscinale CENA21]